MYRISREIHFCYGHRLLDYDGKCRFLHGHNGRAIITLESPTVDNLGMVLDFTKLKQVVGKWIDDTLDHQMLLNSKDPLVAQLQDLGEKIQVVPFNPTAENIARMIFEYTKSQGFPVVEVRLWETENCYASYHA